MRKNASLEEYLDQAKKYRQNKELIRIVCDYEINITLE